MSGDTDHESMKEHTGLFEVDTPVGKTREMQEVYSPGEEYGVVRCRAKAASMMPAVAF